MNAGEAELLVVTYHYLSAAAFPGKGVHAFGPERFREQVERLAQGSRFLSLEELEENRRPPLGSARRYVLLTFDDGLAEQFEVAWPILEGMGIPGAFFPCTSPLQTGKLLHVHRLHALRGAMADPDLSALFLELAENRGFEESARAILSGECLAAPYPYDTPQGRFLKSLFNYTLPLEEREALSALAFERVFGEEAPWAERLYMTPAMIRELARNGCLGTHTHAHRPLSRLDRESIRQEICESLDILEKTAGVRPRSLSYPYGNCLSVSPEVFEVAEACGLRCGFTTERRANFPGTDRLQLARFDAEDLPPGKRPIASL
ncbi:MAG: polysaccharide deacetylase family protein [Synergistaceae bacterium]|nr:polysaccharide deacetylase family protein [Synergistaceae bacterium]